MTRTTPLVSIVIPAYNAERFLGEALASVRAQSHDAIEVIVCDDASTDATPTIAAGTGDIRIRYLRNEQTLGGYGAMNRGVRESQGEFVAIYHADDVYDPLIVERELAFLMEHEEVGAVFCLDRFIDESGKEYDRLRLPPALSDVETIDAALLVECLLRFKNTFLRTPSVMFRRTAFDAVGGYDQKGFGIAADLDMWARLSLRTHIGLIHEHLMGYRHYGAQWSRQYERVRTEAEMFFAVMDRHLARPTVRALASPTAMRKYDFWRALDEVTCAANACLLGDAKRARAILERSPVLPLLSEAPGRHAVRAITLRSLVFVAARTGGKPMRALVHLARFRRLPQTEIVASAPTVTQSLGSPVGDDRPSATV